VQLDMAALFGEVPVPDLDTLWQEDRSRGAAQGMSDALSHPSTPGFEEGFPVPDVPWPQETSVEESVGAEEPAIEADWILETDQPEEDKAMAEGLAGWDAPPEAAVPDLWQAFSADSDTLPESVAPAEEVLNWSSPAIPEQETPEADFLDHLGETPDFGEVDWSVFQGLSEEVSGIAESEIPRPESAPAEDFFSQWSDAELLASQEVDAAERILDAALAHPDEQQLHQEIDAAFEDILAADDLLSEAAEPISLPEWLPGPEEASSDQDQTQPSLGDLVAALSDEQMPESQEQSVAVAALDESLQWLEDSLDSDGEDLLAALAAAGAQDQQPEEALAEPAAELPDWIRQAAPPAEVIADETGLSGFPPDMESSEVLAEILPGDVENPAPAEEKPDLSLLAEWETVEAAQVPPPDLPVEAAPQEVVEAGTQAEEDWLQIFAEEQPLDYQEEPEASAEEAPLSSESSWAEAPAEEIPQEGYETHEPPVAQTEEERLSVEAEAVARDEAPLTEPDWLTEISEEEIVRTPDEELQALLSQPYDPFEAGSAENVPRYQAAGETGILQPDERPDWMTAFLGDEVPETGELPETAPAALEEIVTRPLYDEEFGEEAVAPSSEELAGQAEAGTPENVPADEWTVSEEKAQPEGEIPEWLMAIADSEADKLSELFATDELFTLPEEAFGATGEGAQQPLQAAQTDRESLAMPETLEAFFAAEDIGEPQAEAQPLAEPLEVAPASALSDTWAEEVSLEDQGEAALPPADEYADEPVPEDFSFGDWVPIWLRAPLEGIPQDLPGLRGDAPPSPPEWLRDVAEEDET